MNPSYNVGAYQGLGMPTTRNGEVEFRSTLEIFKSCADSTMVLYGIIHHPHHHNSNWGTSLLITSSLWYCNQTWQWRIPYKWRVSWKNRPEMVHVAARHVWLPDSISHNIPLKTMIFLWFSYGCLKVFHISPTKVSLGNYKMTEGFVWPTPSGPQRIDGVDGFGPGARAVEGMLSLWHGRDTPLVTVCDIEDGPVELGQPGAFPSVLKWIKIHCGWKKKMVKNAMWQYYPRLEMIANHI